MYLCTKRELLDECPHLEKNFKVTCKNAIATLKSGDFKVSFEYQEEKYKGHPVCQQLTTKEAGASFVIITGFGAP